MILARRSLTARGSKRILGIAVAALTVAGGAAASPALAGTHPASAISPDSGSQSSNNPYGGTDCHNFNTVDLYCLWYSPNEENGVWDSSQSGTPTISGYFTGSSNLTGVGCRPVT
jgi:hypothetical protein